MPDIRIEEWSLKYVESYRECLGSVARERVYLGLIGLPAEEETRSFLGSNPGLIQYFALERETVIGWCDIRPRTLPGFTHAGVLGMGVLAPYRRRGLGRLLMETCVEKAWKSGLIRIELEVFASNEIAIALYENLGFKIEGRNVRARYLDGVWDDVIWMGLLRDV